MGEILTAKASQRKDNCMHIDTGNNVSVLHDYSRCMWLPVEKEVTPTAPNWRSQKTKRKNWRRISNAPKAVRRRTGFKERRR